MKKTTKALMLLTLSASLALSANAQAATKIKKAKWKEKTIYVTKGKKINLKKYVKLTPSKAKITTKTVTWKSSKKKVATVSKAGVLKGKRVGTTVVTLKVKGGKSYKVKVRVVNPVKKITVSKPTMSVSGSGSINLSSMMQATPASATVKDLVWTSSDTSIATVNSKGIVTPLRNGKVTISAQSLTNPEVKGSTTLTVSGITGTGSSADGTGGAGGSGSGGTTGGTGTGGTGGTGGSTGGSTGGGSGTGSTDTGVVEAATLVFDMNVPTGATLITKAGDNVSKFPGIGVSYTFSIPSTNPYVQGYKFMGYATSKSGSVQYRPGGSIIIKGGQTVTLYAQWKKVKSKTLYLIGTLADFADEGWTMKINGTYYLDEECTTPLTYFVRGNEEYILRNAVSTGEHFSNSGISSITGINLVETADKIKAAIGVSSFNRTHLSTLEDRLNTFYIESAGKPYTDRIGLYNSARAFIDGEYTLDKCTGEFTVGSTTLTKAQERKAMEIWAEVMDSWRETKNGTTIGFWDFAMYGNAHFTYDVRSAQTNRKGIAQGVQHSYSGAGEGMIAGPVTVYYAE